MRLIKKIEHVAIVITNMDQSIQYYTTMFGFEVRVRGSNERREMAFLRHVDFPDFEIELIRDLQSITTYAEVGIVNHLAFTVENIEEAMAYYKEKGVEFLSDSPNEAIDGAKVIFFKGPDQELLQLVQPIKAN